MINKVPVSAIADHHHYGRITVQLDEYATKFMGYAQYICVDDPEMGYFDLEDLEIIQILQ